MGDIGSFIRRFDILIENVGENAAKTVRKAALAADQAVVLATPVDTGRARANWIVGLGAPSDDTVPTPGSPGAGLQQALETGRSTIEAHKEGAIHLTNNLPYIARLEDGYSKQAPTGMTQQAIAAAQIVIHNQRLLEK